jgi:hypothetical protein
VPFSGSFGSWNEYFLAFKDLFSLEMTPLLYYRMIVAKMEAIAAEALDLGACRKCRNRQG